MFDRRDNSLTLFSEIWQVFVRQLWTRACASVMFLCELSFCDFFWPRDDLSETRDTGVRGCGICLSNTSGVFQKTVGMCFKCVHFVKTLMFPYLNS